MLKEQRKDEAQAAKSTKAEDLTKGIKPETNVKSYKKNGNDIIEEFILDGITILGTQRNSMQIAGEGVTGAHLEIKHLNLLNN